MRYVDRMPFCKNDLVKKLFHLMDEKQTNLALSADLNSCEKVLALAKEVGSEICVLKTHVDILDDFTPAFPKALQKLANRYQFLLFEDRKFADIGNTVKQQYQGGMYHIAEWADMVNAHSLPGPGIIKGLEAVELAKKRGLLMLAEMSSENNLMDAVYAQRTVELAEQFPEFVMGFIAQRKLSDDPKWIYMTPGVQLTEGEDTLGQQYITPEQAILCNGTDIIIVGRGILQARDRLAAAKQYRDAGWKAYQSTL